MKIDKLLIATHNPGKYHEMAEYCSSLKIQTCSLSDLNISDDYDETGETFEDNAIGKAKFYYQLAHMPTLADDAGLCVDYLHGEPGVHSRRWGGHKGTDQEILDMLLTKLTGVALEQRTAQFVAALALYDGQDLIVESGECIGRIGLELACPIKPGIPFSSVFYPEGYNQVASQLSTEEKNKISHRGQALRKIVLRLQNDKNQK